MSAALADTEPTVPLLEIRGLAKTFLIREGLEVRALKALQDVSFSVARGEAVALVGESGSGKSTVARLVARLLEATDGSVKLSGDDISTGRPTLAFRRKVQMIFQDPFGSLNPIHRVGHHIDRPLLRHKIVATKAAARARTAELLETVGLSRDFDPDLDTFEVTFWYF